jgi:hypothetical protein
MKNIDWPKQMAMEHMKVSAYIILALFDSVHQASTTKAQAGAKSGDIWR